MLATCGRIAVILTAAALSTIGVLTLSTTALIVWVVVAGLAGAVLATGVWSWRIRGEYRQQETSAVWGHRIAELGPVPLGLATFATALVAALSLTGLAVAFGAAATVGAVVVFLAGLAWRLWRDSQPLTAQGSGAAPGDDTTPVSPGVEIREELVATTLSIKPDRASTPDLCVVWRRSYWLLLELPAGTTRNRLVDVRQNLLDELERRDYTGFHRWLETGARAGSDPSPYLVDDA